jgi:hypothetical protein
MVLFIFTLILMFSLFGVIYLLVRALPRLSENASKNHAGYAIDHTSSGSSTDEDGAVGADLAAGSVGMGFGGAAGKNIFDRWAHSEFPEKIDAFLNSFLLKFLRKFKVFVLKLDNMVSHHLRRIHRETGEKKAIDFKDISEKSEEE